MLNNNLTIHNEHPSHSLKSCINVFGCFFTSLHFICIFSNLGMHIMHIYIYNFHALLRQSLNLLGECLTNVQHKNNTAPEGKYLMTHYIPYNAHMCFRFCLLARNLQRLRLLVLMLERLIPNFYNVSFYCYYYYLNINPACVFLS